jgi:U32 family peptidase
MKIVVGLPGSATPESVVKLAKAGAAEFFLGYVPPLWADNLGYEFSPNRRYRSGQQVTRPEQLTALCKAAGTAPVSLTFNEHSVTSSMWERGRRILSEAVESGVSAVIVADLSIVPIIRKVFPEIAVHVSGDAGIYNESGVRLCRELGAERVIFPRELALLDMLETAQAVAGIGIQLEAFILGEPCVYDGARCFTAHGYDFPCDFCNFHTRKDLRIRGQKGGSPLDPPQEGVLDSPGAAEAWCLGKCGLCAIPVLAGGGITHLKVPGRSSAGIVGVRLVDKVLRDGPKTSEIPGLLEAGQLCASGHLCYYPEVRDA